MEKLNFDNLMSVQFVDTGTADIIGQYYIEGKYVDFKLNLLFLVFIGLGFLIFCFFSHKSSGF